MGMAEHLFNTEEKIVVDEVVPHYLYYEASDKHRFSSVSKMDGVLICRRWIAHYSYLDSIEQKNPVEQIQRDRLYISSVCCTLSTGRTISVSKSKSNVSK